MRHQLTKEERQRGGKTAMAKLRESGKSHQLTDQDRFYGGFNMSQKVLAGKAKRYQLTPEDRRKGGLARQAQLRKEEEIGRELEAGRRVVVEVASTGRRFEYQLPASPEPTPEPPELGSYCARDVVAGPDPFTLSALRRFMLGPKTPFELRRSEREHLPILRAGGWIQGADLISLTEKGRLAVGMGG